MTPCACPPRNPDWHGRDVDLGGTLDHTLSLPMLKHKTLAYGVYLVILLRMLMQLVLAEQWPGLVLTSTGFFRGSLPRLLEQTRSPARNLRTLARPNRVYAALNHGNLSTGHKVIQQKQMKIVDDGRRPRE